MFGDEDRGGKIRYRDWFLEESVLRIIGNSSYAIEYRLEGTILRN